MSLKGTPQHSAKGRRTHRRNPLGSPQGDRRWLQHHSQRQQRISPNRTKHVTHIWRHWIWTVDLIVHALSHGHFLCWPPQTTKCERASEQLQALVEHSSCWTSVSLSVRISFQDSLVECLTDVGRFARRMPTPRKFCTSCFRRPTTTRHNTRHQLQQTHNNKMTSTGTKFHTLYTSFISYNIDYIGEMAGLDLTRNVERKAQHKLDRLKKLTTESAKESQLKKLIVRLTEG